MTLHLIQWCAAFIRHLGYSGIFVLMVCESMYVPIPSFAVMPFVGFVAHQIARGNGTDVRLDFWGGVLVGALGGIVGSLLTYGFGYWAGPVGVRRYGRFVGLIEEDLDETQAWFARRGAIAVFTGRFIPVVRHFISTVAGLAHMKIPAFLAMTFAGAFLWDLVLAYCGWVLEAQYDRIALYTKPLDVLVIICFAVGGWLFWKRARARMKEREARRSGAVSPPPAPLDAPGAAP